MKHYRFFRVPRSFFCVVSLFTALPLFKAAPLAAQVVQKEFSERKGVDVVERLGGHIPLEIEFTSDSGEKTALGAYFHKGKPALLILAYYECPMLCTLVLNGVSDAVRALDILPGEDFRILTVSIDPRETVELARAKKYRYVESIGKEGIDDGWTFFVGDGKSSRTLADSLGFHYYYDEAKDQYAHAAALFVLTEEGKIARYFYGIEFNPRDLRFALMEASAGKIGNTLDKIILFCYHYDPGTNGYVPFAANIMRLGGVVSVLFLGVLIGTLAKRERSRNRGNGAEHSK